jgi:hypothetical protein
LSRRDGDADAPEGLFPMNLTRWVLIAALMLLLPVTAPAAVQILYLPTQDINWTGEGPYSADLVAFCTDHEAEMPDGRNVERWHFLQIENNTPFLFKIISHNYIIVDNIGRDELFIGKWSLGSRRLSIRAAKRVFSRIAKPTLAIPNPDRRRADEMAEVIRGFTRFQPYFRDLDLRLNSLIRRGGQVSAFEEAVQWRLFWNADRDADRNAAPTQINWHWRPEWLPPLSRFDESHEQRARRSVQAVVGAPVPDTEVGRWLLDDSELVRRLRRFPARLSLMRHDPELAPRMVAFLLVNNMLRESVHKEALGKETTFSRFRSGADPDAISTMVSTLLKPMGASSESPTFRDFKTIVSSLAGPSDSPIVFASNDTLTSLKEFASGEPILPGPGLELLIDVRPLHGDPVDRLPCIFSNIVKQDGDLAFRWIGPDDDIKAEISALLDEAPRTQRQRDSSMTVWVKPVVLKKYPRLNWPEKINLQLITVEKKTSEGEVDRRGEPLPRLSRRSLDPDEVHWAASLRALIDDGLLDSIEYREGVVSFDARNRKLTIASSPPPSKDQGEVLSVLRRLISLDHDFAVQGAAALIDGPCVMRLNSADPGKGPGEAIGLRDEIQKRGIRNPIAFTTQDNLEAALERLSHAWHSWTYFEVHVDPSIRYGKRDKDGHAFQDEEGDAIMALNGKLIGSEDGRSVIIRVFHNQGSLLDELLGKIHKNSREFEGQLLVIGGCPVDRGKLLELQDKAIAGGALGVFVPFVDSIDRVAVALSLYYLLKHPGLLRDGTPGDVVRRGYEQAAAALQDCVGRPNEPAAQHENRLKEAFEEQVKEAFGEQALVFFRGRRLDSPAEKVREYKPGKVRTLPGELRRHSRWFLDFVDASDLGSVEEGGARRMAA